MSYLKTASSGIFWMGLGSIAAKISSFLSLIVLGWFLTKEEFATYAIALSSSIIFCALRNGGVQQIIAQRGARGYGLAINMYYKYALSANLFAFFMVLLASTFIIRLFNNEYLLYILVAIAVSLPLSTSGTIFRLSMVTQLKFSDVAKFDIYSSIVRHGSAALFCVLGLGVFSFVLPMIVAAAFEHFYGKYKTGVTLLRGRKITLYKFKVIFNKGKWLILSAIFIAIALQGDYFVVGLFESSAVVGLYFFGFQIIASVIAIASQGMQTVILPIVSMFKDDRKRQADAYSKMVVILTTVVALLSIQVYLFAPYLINFIWGGKWDEAIPVLQIMSISLVTWLLIPLAKSVIESRGQWKAVSYLMIFDALGIVSAAIIGALIGGLHEVTICVSLFRLLFGFLCAIYVADLLGIKKAEILRIILVIFCCAMFSLYCVSLMVEFFAVNSFIANAAIYIFISTIVYLVSLYLLQRSTLMDALSYMKLMLKK